MDWFAAIAAGLVTQSLVGFDPEAVSRTHYYAHCIQRTGIKITHPNDPCIAVKKNNRWNFSQGLGWKSKHA